MNKNYKHTIRYKENKSKQRQGGTRRYREIQKAIVFFVSISARGESSPLKPPFFGEMIMEEKEKLIVFFVCRIGSGETPVTPFFHVCFVFCVSGVNPS